VLGGLANSILLLCVAAFVSICAIARFFNPEDVGVDRLLVTSIVGFFINLIGVAAVFGHQTTDAGRRDLNVRALFVHVSADCAGSLVVIVSSFLVDQYNLHIADAVASLVVGMLIFVSAVPIVRSAVSILMQGLTAEEKSILEETMRAVRAIDGVVDVMNSHFWMTTTMSFVMNLRVKLHDDADEQKSLDAVLSALRERGIRDVCVQMEKLDFVKRYSFHSISPPEEFGIPPEGDDTV
jgi:cation diffusion facilitator family transporter